MTDQQQIEKVWREQFEAWITENYSSKSIELNKGEYLYANTRMAWITWLAAKRAQKPVELPVPHSSDGFRYFHEIDVAHCIEAAGYAYTIKGG